MENFLPHSNMPFTILISLLDSPAAHYSPAFWPYLQSLPVHADMTCLRVLSRLHRRFEDV